MTMSPAIQRAFDHVQRPAAAVTLRSGADFFGVGADELGDAVHQRVRSRSATGAGAPGPGALSSWPRPWRFLGDLDQRSAASLRRLTPHPPTRSRGWVQLVVDADHAGVDDAHVQPGLDGVVEEHGVDRLAHRVVAAEAEAHVADAARDLGARQVPLDPARGLDEVDRVVVVLLDAGGDGEDVGVEDDVLGREADLLDQDAPGARCRSTSCARRCRPGPCSSKAITTAAGAVAAHQLRLAAELFAFFS